MKRNSVIGMVCLLALVLACTKQANEAKASAGKAESEVAQVADEKPAQPPAANEEKAVEQPIAEEKKMANPTVTLQTNMGTIVMELWPDKAPKTVENFLGLVNKGFYDGIRFHRVIPGFMIQGGDPLTKDPEKKQMWGTGGPDYKFADEPVQGEYTRGALAMANAGPNTNGSQFFICVVDLSGKLPKNYNLFGQVLSGMEVADKIAAAPRDPKDCPLSDVIIEKATVSGV